jgi:hypothetical protein
MSDSGWLNMELWIHHDGSDTTLQMMEDLLELIEGVLRDVLEDTEFVPDFQGALNGPPPDWADDE